MLTAVGIDSEIVPVEEGFALVVEQPVRAHALHHLHHYEQERQPRGALPERFTPRPQAWKGSLAYILVMLVAPFALAQGWFLVDPYRSGAMDPARVLDGEWWRLVTALTLHWDAAHLVGNLGGGALLGYSAAQAWGNARAWLLILIAAVAANGIEALMGMSGYVSAGASTAVFAALGLVAAFTWRTRRQKFATPLVRWAPLIAGAAMLGFFGAGSSVPVAGMPLQEYPGFADPTSTNVLSHLLGFLCGIVAGALATAPRGMRMLQSMPTWLAAAISPVVLLLAWTLAQR